MASNFKILYKTKPGVYILENTPPPGGGNISRCHLGGKIWRGEEKKGENVKEKGRQGKENEKRGKKGKINAK
jgi:hypothetical protein